MNQEKTLPELLEKARELTRLFHTCQRSVEHILDGHGYLPKKWPKMSPEDLIREVAKRKTLAQQMVQQDEQNGRVS